MMLEVRLYATLRRYAVDRTDGVVTIDLPEGATVGELLDGLGIPADEVKLAMVNGIHAEVWRVLIASDRIGLFPPVGGG